MIYSLLVTVTGLLNQQFFPNVSETTENVRTIYDNKDNVKVVYQDLNYTYEGGAESKGNLRSVLAGLTERHNKLTVTKGTESITKAIDEDEIVGSKNGIVTQIEYGTRKHLQTTRSSRADNRKELCQSSSETEKPTRQKSNRKPFRRKNEIEKKEEYVSIFIHGRQCHC